MGFGSGDGAGKGGFQFMGTQVDTKGYYFSATMNEAGEPRSEIYSFGWKPGDKLPARGLPAFRLPSTGDTFYATEMIIAVSDQRTIPIGWTSWTAASTNGDCTMDCDTGLVTRDRTRHCRCFLDGTVIENDSSAGAAYDANFADKCQPCGPEEHRTKTENCTLPSCETEAAANPETSNSYMHHYCCEASTAIRVRNT